MKKKTKKVFLTVIVILALLVRFNAFAVFYKFSPSFRLTAGLLGYIIMGVSLGDWASKKISAQAMKDKKV